MSRLLCRLEMAQKLVETENIEFFVLVQRLQEINARLEKDTEELIVKKAEEDKKTEEKGAELEMIRKKQLKNRKGIKIQKEDWLKKKAAAFQTEEELMI